MSEDKIPNPLTDIFQMEKFIRDEIIKEIKKEYDKEAKRMEDFISYAVDNPYAKAMKPKKKL